jgi:hypothetical protein
VKRLDLRMLTCSRGSVPEDRRPSGSVVQRMPLVTASGNPGLSSWSDRTHPNVPGPHHGGIAEHASGHALCYASNLHYGACRDRDPLV